MSQSSKFAKGVHRHVLRASYFGSSLMLVNLQVAFSDISTDMKRGFAIATWAVLVHVYGTAAILWHIRKG